MPLLHELHMAIDKALREHHIEIPFPQRDPHLRSVDPAIGWQEVVAGGDDRGQPG